MNTMPLPSDFIAQLQPIIGEDWNQFEAALTEKPIISIRINNKFPLQNSLNRVPWCPEGFYLNERPNFTLDPLLHAGAYYVQEASSMFVYQAFKQFVSSDATVLDLCAAPGGKSTLISQFLNNDGLLVCNEFIRSRSQILAENIQKWGNPNVIVTNNAPRDFEHLSGMFDAVLVDAPCSGEGMFRKDTVAVTEWSLANVKQCVIRQREIVQSAWECLKEDGILIYSTCTYNQQENEENVAWICDTLGAQKLVIEVEPSWGITTTEGGHHFYPHKTRGEGFFLSILRKTKAVEYQTKFKQKNIKKDKKLLPCETFIKDNETFDIIEYKHLIYAFCKKHDGFLQRLLEKNYVIHFGTTLAEQKGNDFIPQTGLALSKILNRNNFNSVEVSWEQAIAFLRTEALYLTDCPKGFLLICYKNLPIGWVKNIGNRSNNLYPEHWRIRMQLNANTKETHIL